MKQMYVLHRHTDIVHLDLESAKLPIGSLALINSQGDDIGQNPVPHWHLHDKNLLCMA